MRRLFLDANVLFSAAYKHDSAQGLLIELAAAGLITAISSAYAIEEARRNLIRKSPKSIQIWPNMLAVIAIAPEPDTEHLAWAGAIVVAKDAPVLASAVRAKVDWFMTGDRSDFGHLFSKTVRNVLVIPPAEAVRRLTAESESGR